jgi:hypothetical protein
MGRQEDNIVNCAKRLTAKLAKSEYHKLNGEYPKPVQVEIERMMNHCRDKHDSPCNPGDSPLEEAE